MRIYKLTDATLNKCSIPEIPIPIREIEDLVYGEYAAGSVVLARLGGWPWWPAMVDDCPDTEQYYWLDGFSDIPVSVFEFIVFIYKFVPLCDILGITLILHTLLI